MRKSSDSTAKDHHSNNNTSLFSGTHRKYTFLKMDPMSQLNYEYNLFKNSLNFPGAAPGAETTAPTGRPLVTSATRIMAIPEDPPSRPAWFIDQEHLLKRLEGFFVAGMLVMAIILKGWFGIAVIIGVTAFLLYNYILGYHQVALYNFEQELRAENRLTPKPQAQPRYILQEIQF
jgi:hypothetical protein